MAPQFFKEYVLANFAMAQSIWLALSGWIELMLSLPILTTLYGHYIQGRVLV